MHGSEGDLVRVEWQTHLRERLTVAGCAGQTALRVCHPLQVLCLAGCEGSLQGQRTP